MAAKWLGPGVFNTPEGIKKPGETFDETKLNKDRYIKLVKDGYVEGKIPKETGAK